VWRNKNRNSLPTKLQVLFRLCPVQPPSTLFDFRLWSRAQITNMLQPPRNPVLMDIDASRKTQPLPFSCYRCGKAGHKAPDCPTLFDIWELSIDDLQTYLEDCLAELDVKHPEPTVEVEEQDFSHRNKWTACPHCHITIVSLFYLHVPLMKQLNHLQMCKIPYPRIRLLSWWK